MGIWRERLADVDDDYLIGLSNKGIVKRAYKDKGETAARILNMEEEASVEVGEETVTVRYPLGESKCSCPSRSMCRHVVHAILTLRESALAEESAGILAADEEPGQSGPQEKEPDPGSAGAPREGSFGTDSGERAQMPGSVREDKEENLEADSGERMQPPDSAGVNKEGSAETDSGERTQMPGSAKGDKEGSSEVDSGERTQMLGSAKGDKEGSSEADFGEKSQLPGSANGDKEESSETDSGKKIILQGQKKAAELPVGQSGAAKQPIRDTAAEETRPAGRQEPAAGTVQKSAVWKEINAYPFAKLKSVLGVRQFQTFVNQAAAGIRPEIRATSVVTVRLPGQGYVVKLLAPLEYATCTCHKKELCVHKAAAILWCQLEAGTLTKEILLGEITQIQEYDPDGVKSAAAQMKTFLEELFATGLSRTSPDVLDYLERLAIISHNEGLARFEGYFRSLSDSYDKYFARKASFQTEDLMTRMTRLYRRVELLRKAGSLQDVGKLAGAFRADYLPVGNLNLIGIAMEHFENQAGYEGETLYFLEENTKKWYTYTNARPMFYDSRKRRGYMEKAQSPWGLNISFEDMLKVRIRLTGAKCDDRNRLSSSQETKGEIIGEQGLHIWDVGDWYYRDFGKLFSDQIGKQQKGWLTEQENAGTEAEQEGGDQGDGPDRAGKGVELVFVQPASCAKAEFSRTGQQLTLPLYDRAGRELLVEVTYSKQESGTIRYLERITEKKLPCFLGKVYLRDGRVRMYPVDVMELKEDWEVPDSLEEARQEADVQKEGPQQGNDFSGIDVTGRRSKYEVMEELAEEAGSLLEDLYQSGFDTVHDSTLKDMQRNAELTEQYGMRYLSQLLADMAEEIEKSRHRMEKQPARLAELYVRVSEYLYLARQKTAYDRGQSYYI